MFFSFQAFLVNTLFYPFLAIFVLYIIGRPKYLVTQTNKLWSLRVTKYQISVFTGLSFIFGLGALYNFINRREREITLKEMYEGSYNAEAIDNQKKLIFLCERGIFLYLAFFIMTLVFVKFADVYEKKYELEARIEISREENGRVNSPNKINNLNVPQASAGAKKKLD